MRKPTYDPTEEEIHDLCGKIRKSWSDQEFERRGFSKAVPWSIPVAFGVDEPVETIRN